MIKINMKEEKGITLVTLILAILIMIIIASTILYNANTGLQTRDLNNMYHDIQALKDKVDMYYSQNGNLPMIDQTYQNSRLEEIKTLNPNDNENYYVIDLNLLDNLTLNYGKAYQVYKENPSSKYTDIYIVNEKSHNVYYAEGISFDNKTYYTIPGNYTEVKVNTQNCNHPQLAEGMTPVKWNGTEFTKTQSYDPEWYQYTDTSVSEQQNKSNWANAQTKDGSMWVWIPRFAYKITYTNASDASQGGTIDIVFLKGTTNFDFNGKDVTQETYTNEKGEQGAYSIHPAFQDGSETGLNNNYVNGEWDKEIEGFWMAKFEAGYVGEPGQPSTAANSNIGYSTIFGQDGVYTKDITSNYYGTREIGTKIKYPTFQANRPSMNYIGISDAYDLCKDIKNGSSVYGLSNVDSHLTKNSEWGAVTYLTHSKYGRNGTEVTINNVSLNNTTNTIFAVTGYAGATTSASEETTTLSAIKNGSQSGSFATSQGQTASSTGNVYGIYDLSGGAFEYTAAYIAPTAGNYQIYGGSLQGESSKYKSKYNGISTNNLENYNETNNKNRIGEAIWETSITSTGTSGAGSSWNNDQSNFMVDTSPFFVRGGQWAFSTATGIFAFVPTGGVCNYSVGFRAVLIAEDEGETETKQKINYVDDGEGNKIPVPEGFTYIEGTKDTGLVIKNDVDNNEFVWVPVEGMNYSYARYEFEGFNISLWDKYSEALPKDEQTSINRYGGYYIGRYETGIEGYTNLTKTEDLIAPSINWTGYEGGKLVIQPEKQVWNWITKEKAIEKATGLYNKEKDNIQSKLCSSYAWDTALKFMESKGSTYPTNSVGGYYSKSSPTVTGYDTTHPCNIYDMGGNVWEWTTEDFANASVPFVVRRWKLRR